MGFVFLSSAFQGAGLMIGESLFLDFHISEEKVSNNVSQKLSSKDYSSYIDFITIYMISLCVIFLIFFTSMEEKVMI